MKTILQTVQVTGIVFFLCLSGYVVLGQEHLKELARDYINKRIEPKATNSVLFAEEALNSPKAREFLSEEQLSALQLEIVNYKDDPELYIQKLTDDEVSGGKRDYIESKIGNPVVAALVEKIVGWKESVERYFNEVFKEIIIDLLIFSATNIAAFGIALWLSRKEGMVDWVPYRTVSIVLTISIAYACIMYVDQSWFFTILLKSYFGLGYPIIVFTAFGSILYHYSEIRKNYSSNKSMDLT